MHHPPISWKREHPWNERQLSYSDEVLLNRISLHRDLLSSWYRAFEKDINVDSLQFQYSHEIPIHILGDLELKIWKHKIKLLEELQPGKRSDGSVAEGVLEQTAWSHGFKYGSEVFSGSHPRLITHFSQWLESLGCTSFPSAQPHLVLRKTHNELKMELGFCPHLLKNHIQASERIFQQLCNFHEQWIRGFAYAASPKLTLLESAHLPHRENKYFQHWVFEI